MYDVSLKLWRIQKQLDDDALGFVALLDPSSSSSSSSSAAGSKKTADGAAGKKGKGSKQSKRKAPDELWNDGNPPPRANPLDSFLVESPPKNSNLNDPSLDVLCLLR